MLATDVHAAHGTRDRALCVCDVCMCVQCVLQWREKCQAAGRRVEAPSGTSVSYAQIRDFATRSLCAEVQGFQINDVSELKAWSALHELPSCTLEELTPVSLFSVEPSMAQCTAHSICPYTIQAVAVTSKEMLRSLLSYVRALKGAGFRGAIGVDVDGKHKLSVDHWVLLSAGGRRLRMDPTQDGHWVQTFTPFIFSCFPSEDEPSIIYLLLALKVGY